MFLFATQFDIEEILTLGLIINIVTGVPLSLLLIPSYRVIGLLILQLIAPNTSFFYSFFWIKRNWDRTIQWKTMAKLYAITVLSMIFAYALTISLTMNPLLELILGGSIITVLHLTLLLLTVAINSLDLKEVRKIISPIKPIQQLAKPFLTVMERIAK